MRKEEGKSGSNEEDTELDNLFQNITEEWNETSASHDDRSKQKLKKIETEKSNSEGAQQQAMETFAETRKENSKMTIVRANETMAEKPWYILEIALNKKIKKTRVSPSARKANTTATTTEFIPATNDAATTVNASNVLKNC